MLAIGQTDILGIVGIGIGVLGVAAAVLAARRWGNRRGRLAFEVQSTPLMPGGESGRAGLLKVTFRDIEVTDPHLVTVRLANVGPGDVASDDFDAGRPLLVTLNCTMFGITASSYPEPVGTTAIGGEGKIELPPTLLRRGEEWIIEAVVGGYPVPKLDENFLINTDIVEGQTRTIEVVVTLTERLFGILRIL
jgi:hypothetical protein